MIVVSVFLSVQHLFGMMTYPIRRNHFKSLILLLLLEIVICSSFQLFIAISIPDADISYGYILYNYKDLTASDSSLQKAMSAIWNVLCGKDSGLLDKPSKSTENHSL